MNLTSTQRSAIEHISGNLQLIACAGSGKTEVVAQRVVSLLRPVASGGAGCTPENVVAFTFTDKATVFDSDWERQAAEYLGSHPSVAAWVKNDRLGLVIAYRKEGVTKKYLPDFIVELESGEKLIIEIKGQVGNAPIKKAAAERWCRAVTNLGRFGAWKYHLCFGQSDLEALLG